MRSVCLLPRSLSSVNYQFRRRSRLCDHPLMSQQQQPSRASTRLSMSAYDAGASASLRYGDSVLGRKFGPEVVNYFSGSPLNRVSFLRSNHTFLRSALTPAKFLLLRNLDPLVQDDEHLAFVGYEDVKSLVGDPFSVEDEKRIDAYDSRDQVPLLLLLGLDEADLDQGLTFEEGEYRGQPYFALDVTSKGGDEMRGRCEEVIARVRTGGREFKKTRIDLTLVNRDAAILAQARSLTDWNSRNEFCAACGERTMSVQAGTKRTCPPRDKAFQKNPDDDHPHERAPCVTRKGVHNIAFPRTDPTVIMAIVSHKGDKVLLGRQRRWPDRFYSCLAGFCEPAESVEEAVRRETWEESGVRVGRVVVHSTQPWPYPASLMLGCVGEALPDGEGINLGHDPELHDASWFPISFIKDMLARPQAGLQDAPPEGFGEGDIRVPPSTAIAHQLLLAVCNNFHGGLKI